MKNLQTEKNIREIVSKSCAKIKASVFRTKAEEVSGICCRQNYIRGNFTICAPQKVFEMMMLERVACMERMTNTRTHNIVDSNGKSTRKIQT